jgi:hypothetical protein
MTKTTKVLLAISISAFALGFTNILWGLGRPVGAIFLGLFMIFKLLEKEMALFDEEQRRNLALAERNQRLVDDRATCPTAECANAPRLISARAR